MNYEQAETEIRELQRNAFGPPRGYYYSAAYALPIMPRRALPRPWVPAGAQAAWLRAAAIRTLTQGEG